MKYFWERTFDYIDYNFDSPDDIRMFVPFGELIAQGSSTGVFKVSDFVKKEYNVPDNMVLIITFDKVKLEVLKSVIPDFKFKYVDRGVISMHNFFDELESALGLSFFFCEKLDKVNYRPEVSSEAIKLAKDFIDYSKLWHNSNKLTFQLKKEYLEFVKSASSIEVVNLGFVFIRDAFYVSKSVGGIDLDFHADQLVKKNGRTFCIDPFLNY